MGLSISRTIVENHGGRLSVVAQDGPGASFEFTLPVYR
jgi:signal transduction histidine kinase